MLFLAAVVLFLCLLYHQSRIAEASVPRAGKTVFSLESGALGLYLRPSKAWLWT